MKQVKQSPVHPDTVRLDWLEKYHHLYDPFRTQDGGHGVYHKGKVIGWWTTYRKAIDASMKHQKANPCT